MLGKMAAEAEPLIPKVSEAPRKGTIFSSVFVLTTSCVGAGTLSVAYAFSQGGLAFSVAMFVLIISSSVMAAIEMLDAKQLYEEMARTSTSMAVRINSYPTLGEAAFGRFGKVSERPPVEAVSGSYGLCHDLNHSGWALLLGRHTYCACEVYQRRVCNLPCMSHMTILPD